MKIAMWSGPRNLSTAMMYSFAARSDFAVWDEPFYGAYLARTGIDHPMKSNVLSATETEANKVALRCEGPVPEGKAHWYMKHMSFHMCEGFPTEWARDCVNVHLIRHPARVIESYMSKRQAPTLTDIGFAHQAALFEQFPGPVIDSSDVRKDPEGTLRKLCAAISLDFDPAMLAWQAGPKPFDGVWATHWYGGVHKSTGFAPEEGPLPELKGGAVELAARAMPYYERMRSEAIT